MQIMNPDAGGRDMSEASRTSTSNDSINSNQSSTDDEYQDNGDDEEENDQLIELVNGRNSTGSSQNNKTSQESRVLRWNSLAKDSKSAIWPSARHGHRMVTIGNKYVVLFGGATADGNIDGKVYVFDFTKENWFAPTIAAENAPPALSAFGMATDGQRYVYIFGGLSEATKINADLFILDCFEWKWSKLVCLDSSKTKGSFGCTLNYYKGKLICFGGLTMTEFRNEEIAYYLNDVYTYDLTGNPFDKFFKWEIILADSNSPMARESHTSLIYGDKLLIFGGTNKNRLPDSWALDLNSYQWQSLGPFHPNDSGLAMHSSFIFGNEIHHYGGWEEIYNNENLKSTASICSNSFFGNNFDGSNLSIFHYESNETYVPRTNASYCSIGSRIFIFGGRTTTNSNKSNQLTLLNDFAYADISRPEIIPRVSVHLNTSKKLGLFYEIPPDSDSVLIMLLSCEENLAHKLEDIVLNEASDIKKGMPSLIYLEKYYCMQSGAYEDLKPNANYYFGVIPKNSFGAGSLQVYLLHSHSNTFTFDVNAKYLSYNNDKETLEISLENNNKKRSTSTTHHVYALKRPDDQDMMAQDGSDQYEFICAGSGFILQILRYNIVKYAQPMSSGYILSLKVVFDSTELKDKSTTVFLNVNLF